MSRIRIFPPSTIDHPWRSTFATLVLAFYFMVAVGLLIWALPLLLGPITDWSFFGPVGA
jgi:hypothetical protein